MFLLCEFFLNLTMNLYFFQPQIIPHLTTEGLSSTSATIAVSYIAIMGMGSKYLFGRLSENFSSLSLMAISVAIQGISLLIILFAYGNTLIIWAGVFIFGLGFGGMGVLIILTINLTKDSGV